MTACLKKQIHKRVLYASEPCLKSVKNCRPSGFTKQCNEWAKGNDKTTNDKGGEMHMKN